MQKFRQSTMVFEKPNILSENFKTLRNPNYHMIQYFFVEILHTFPTYQCLQILSYLRKSRKTWFLHIYKNRFIINPRSKQNKKSLERPFVDIGKQKTCAKFQQKILNSMIVGSRQNFQFSRQITCFLGSDRTLCKFKQWIWHYLKIH